MSLSKLHIRWQPLLSQGACRLAVHGTGTAQAAAAQLQLRSVSRSSVPHDAALTATCAAILKPSRHPGCGLSRSCCTPSLVRLLFLENAFMMVVEEAIAALSEKCKDEIEMHAPAPL